MFSVNQLKNDALFQYLEGVLLGIWGALGNNAGNIVTIKQLQIPVLKFDPEFRSSIYFAGYGDFSPE
jgi:hypothetical protein